jgi:hypothetical protein
MALPLNGGMPAMDFSSLGQLAELYQQPPQQLSLASLNPNGPMRPPGSMAPVFTPEGSGRGSWYSQLPQKGWVDREDKPNSAAYHVNGAPIPDAQQGIALPSRATLGQYFDVTGPDGKVHRLQQTDIGPARWTGKSIDISAAAADQMGYSPKNFPTGAKFSWRPAR